ncbi:regulation of enolase protein 1-like [Pieris napi]|uniref:regulation of enolase protein 1-like n=1 Tax=Pieris napi TaxID=78633 RepID=UPI001FB90A89|nr:regulation of enolase protein 1-like [Pieris napi]
MQSEQFNTIKLNDFQWLNEPSNWNLCDNVLKVSTDNKTDFWQETWYKFHFNTGHLYGIDIKDDFTFQACIEADFSQLYDQAGLMIYLDEKHWLKTGMEYNDGQPMIGSVLTNEVSDWATGAFTGDPKKFWIRLSKIEDTVCIKYSTNKKSWLLLRLCPFPLNDTYFVGLMCCTPQREGLNVKFSDVVFTSPMTDFLHSNC